MGYIKKFDETDIYLFDHNNMELDADIDIKVVDEIALKRIEQATLNRVKVHDTEENHGTRQKKKGFRGWFEHQNRIRKAAVVILFLTALSGSTLGFIALLHQYVPGFGIISSAAKLEVLVSPYTVWRDDYYLRITSLSYNPETKEIKFTAESNGTDGLGHDTGDGIVSGGIYFKEKWSQATPYEESLGKGHYSYGNPSAEYHDEYKLKKELGEYYLELDIVDISHGEGGKAVYTEKPGYIIISFGDLKLVSAAEADELEDLGQVVESNGVSAAAVSRWEKGKLYADILFESSNSNETVVSFSADEENEIELVTDDQQKYKNIGGQVLSNGWKYLLFDTDEPVNGTVSLKSLFIEKSVDKSIKLDIPNIGETKILNRELNADGVKIVIESVRAFRETVVEDGEKSISYNLPDNEIGIDIKCRIVNGISNGRIANDKSYIKGEIKAGNIKNTSKGFGWGGGGLFINGRFNAEDLTSISQITLVINDIMLTAEGNWSIPIVVK